ERAERADRHHHARGPERSRRRRGAFSRARSRLRGLPPAHPVAVRPVRLLASAPVAPLTVARSRERACAARQPPTVPEIVTLALPLPPGHRFSALSIWDSTSIVTDAGFGPVEGPGVASGSGSGLES